MIAQSGTELAIFGALLIFIIGSIIKAGVQASMQNNLQLRALRLALSESYRTTEGEYVNFSTGKDGANARTGASVVILEDRISITAGSKFGTKDRFPVSASASATHSKNLFRPTDYGDRYDLPLSDLFINGQRIPLLVSDFKTITLATASGGRPAWIPPCNESGPAFFNNNAPPNDPPYGMCWWSDCVSYDTCVFVGYNNGDYEMGYMNECVLATGGPGTGDYDIVSSNAGCTVIFTIVGNYPKSKKCCFGSVCVKDCSNLPQDIRFDLDFDGVSDVPAGDRDGFFWQWFLIAGVRNGTATPGLPWGGVQGIFVDPSGEDSPENSQIDCDGDYFEETILNYSVLSSGVIRTLYVVDSQEGDLNSSFMEDARMPGEWRFAGTVGGACGAAPSGNCTIGSTATGNNGAGICSNWRCLEQSAGFSDDTQIYTITSSDPGQTTGQGAYLRVEEGENIMPAAIPGQFSRSTERHDQLDVVERQLQLTRDSGRFCSNDVTPRDWGTTAWARSNGLYGIENPVEACSRPSTGTTCFDPGIIQLTCFDRDSYILYVRSRISDLRGRRWIRRFAP